MLLRKLGLIIIGTAIAFSATAKVMQSSLFQGELYKKAIWGDEQQQRTVFTDCTKAMDKDPKNNDFQTCVADTMKKQGASEQAIFFWNKYIGWVDKFKEYGPVTLVHASVVAADHADKYLLVTKKGELIDVTDNDYLSDQAITQDPNYVKIQKQYPQDFLNPLPKGEPVVKTKDGAQSFIFSYSMAKCMACAIDATFKIAFKFDSQGNFKGVQLVS